LVVDENDPGNSGPRSGWEGMNTTSRRGLTTLKKLRDENGNEPGNGPHELKLDTAGTLLLYYVYRMKKSEK
jgi:hypothetical protein